MKVSCRQEESEQGEGGEARSSLGAGGSPLQTPAPSTSTPSAQCPGALLHRWDTAVPFVGQSGEGTGLGARQQDLSPLLAS